MLCELRGKFTFHDNDGYKRLKFSWNEDFWNLQERKFKKLFKMSTNFFLSSQIVERISSLTRHGMSLCTRQLMLLKALFSFPRQWNWNLFSACNVFTKALKPYILRLTYASEELFVSDSFLKIFQKMNYKREANEKFPIVETRILAPAFSLSFLLRVIIFFSL
jgi:hypothetical protein